MPKNQYHLVPDHNGGWKIIKSGAKKASNHFDTKKEALKRARELSKKYKAELKIHDKHGRIRQSDSHGNDPYPPRDRDTH